MKKDDAHYLRMAIQLAEEGMKRGEGGPFGAVVVDAAGEVVAKGNNRVLCTSDPTAHAEVVAIRRACEKLQHFQLEGCTIYASCEPCPMCLGAIYWARPARLVFAASRHDAADVAGFDDAFIYQEIALPFAERQLPTSQMLREEGLRPLQLWRDMEEKTAY